MLSVMYACERYCGGKQAVNGGHVVHSLLSSAKALTCILLTAYFPL